MRANTPKDFEPPYEAYEAKYEDETSPLVTAFIGTQSRGGDPAKAQEAHAALQDVLGGPDGPEITEQGYHNDTDGAHSRLVMAYWRDAEKFARWRSGNALEDWLTEQDDPMLGRWIETAEVRPRALDTLIARTDVNWGLAKLADLSM